MVLLPGSDLWHTNSGTDCICHPYTLGVDCLEYTVNILTLLFVGGGDRSNELVSFQDVKSFSLKFNCDSSEM